MKRIITIALGLALMAFACNKEAIYKPLIVDTAGVPQPSGQLEKEADSATLCLFSRIMLSEKQLQKMSSARKFKDLKKPIPVRASDPVHQ